MTLWVLIWPLGFCLILVYKYMCCTIPDEIYVAWKELNFQFMLWYGKNLYISQNTWAISNGSADFQTKYRYAKGEKQGKIVHGLTEPYRLTCFVIWSGKVWSDSQSSKTHFCFFLFPQFWRWLARCPWVSHFLRFFPFLLFFCYLQALCGNGVCHMTYLYSTELSRMVFLISVQIWMYYQ